MSSKAKEQKQPEVLLKFTYGDIFLEPIPHEIPNSGVPLQPVRSVVNIDDNHTNPYIFQNVNEDTIGEQVVESVEVELTGAAADVPSDEQQADDDTIPTENDQHIQPDPQESLESTNTVPPDDEIPVQETINEEVQN